MEAETRIDNELTEVGGIQKVIGGFGKKVLG